MRRLDDLLAEGVAGRRVLLRADLNVPLDRATGEITDDGRIRAAVPTLRELLAAGARVLVCSHLGRPKGGHDPALTLAPVARRLAELIGAPVPLADASEGAVAGPAAQALAEQLGDGDVGMLDNLRFEPAETSPDEGERAPFAERLARLTGTDRQGAYVGAYVDDAFGAVHRAHASVTGVPALLPHAAGRLVAAELEVLEGLTHHPDAPYVVVLGGSKVSDKLGVIDALLPRVDRLLVGGGMCFTFLAAQGHEVGASLLERDQLDSCRRLLREAGDRLVLPVDIVTADAMDAGAAHDVAAADALPAARMGLDIGPRTVQRFARELDRARTVFWNGPMGVFELEPFAAGTRGVAEAIAAATGRGATTVVGGGDSAAAVRALGLSDAGDGSAYSHISTGGGASLELLEGEDLPGLVALGWSRDGG